MKRIFIGGTGRSGTTILHHAMYKHHEIYGFPVESKFLVEDSGLSDLVASLTDNFSITNAQGAVRRFDGLMRFHFTERNRNNLGLQYTLPEIFGTTHYYNVLDQFIDTITNGFYTEKEEVGRFSKDLYPSQIASRVNSIPKYFPEREKLLAACRKFTGALFDEKAVAEKKSCWVEKTPSNLTKISFLHELYPDSIFIHIKRDPRSVVYSLLNQIWAPDNIVDAANYMKGTYEKWFDIQSSLPVGVLKNFHEVRLEDLVSGPDQLLNSLVRKCGLSKYTKADLNSIKNTMRTYIGSELSDADHLDRKLNGWKYKLGREDLDKLNNVYGELINAMGYGTSTEKKSLEIHTIDTPSPGRNEKGKSWLKKTTGLIRK